MGSPLTNADLLNIYPVEVLPRIDWTDPVAGKSDEQIKGKIDQFTHRIPFRSISEPKLQVPRIQFSNTDIFLNEGDVFSPSTGIDFTFGSETFEMRPASTLLRISSSSLGTNVADKKLDLLIQSYGQALRRFLSVGVIYGGYPGYYVNVPPSGEEYWRYYLDPNGLSNTPDTWDQSLSFNGLVQACEPLNDIPNNGFYQVIGQPPGPSTGPVSSLPLTLDALDNFIGHFRGANNGHIDCLVMNFELRQNYLQLWRSIGQLPEYIIDPVTGYQCLAHDGIPILVNDYIESYDSSGTNNANVNNPENVPDLIAPATPVTSLFAVVFGEDRGGVFGIYPQSFGSSPIKIEHSRSSEESDTIYLRGMVEAGLAFGSRRGVGRLAGIEIISGT